jgi:hypothetical protein
MFVFCHYALFAHCLFCLCSEFTTSQARLAEYVKLTDEDLLIEHALADEEKARLVNLADAELQFRHEVKYRKELQRRLGLLGVCTPEKKSKISKPLVPFQDLAALSKEIAARLKCLRQLRYHCLFAIYSCCPKEACCVFNMC